MLCSENNSPQPVAIWIRCVYMRHIRRHQRELIRHEGAARLRIARRSVRNPTERALHSRTIAALFRSANLFAQRFTWGGTERAAGFWLPWGVVRALPGTMGV